MLVGLMSGIDMLMMVMPMLPYGAVGPAWLIIVRLFLLDSTAGARPGRVRIIVYRTRPLNSSSFPLTPLYTNQ